MNNKKLFLRSTKWIKNWKKDTLIKIFSFPKIEIKIKKSYMVYKPNLQSYDGYKLHTPLFYVDSLIFFLNQKQIRLTLQNDIKKFLILK